MIESGLGLVEGSGMGIVASAIPLPKRTSSLPSQCLAPFVAVDFLRIRNTDLGRFTLDRLMKMLSSLKGDRRVTASVFQGESVMVT